jgi:hypothetical protein
MYKKEGNKWSTIAASLKGRSVRLLNTYILGKYG